MVFRVKKKPTKNIKSVGAYGAGELDEWLRKKTKVFREKAEDLSFWDPGNDMGISSRVNCL